MPTKTDQIRALNDELRQHVHAGIAVITPGIAALGQEAVDRIVKTSPFTTTSATPTTRTKNTTLVRSKRTATGCSSKSTTSTRL